MSLAPSARLGPYEIIVAIGAGGMGEVYRATDTRLGRSVAVKVMPVAYAGDLDRLQRFEQEARAAAALNHPNIMAVFDVGSHDGAPYVVSELLEGETLRERLATGALPVRKVIEYSVQLAQGLAAAHEKGIVHRDLKPDNVFLTADGRVKILDFGLARLTQPDTQPVASSQIPTTPPNTQAGVVLGTMGYMAPEQVRGLPADHRADIFAFGVVLYEMVSGRRAFHRETTFETMTAIVKEDPPAVPTGCHVPPGLARIIDRCLEKSAAARFQSARDLSFALEGVSSQSDASALPLTSTSAPPSARRNPRLAWACAAVMGAALVAIAALLITGRLQPSPATPEMRLQIDMPDVEEVAGGLAQFAISPDGRKFVFLARSGSGDAAVRTILWLRPMETERAMPLAGTEGALHPFWSPDSRSIGFFASAQLKRIDLADGLIRTLTSAPTPAGGAWSERGTILFARSFAGPLYKIAAGGGEATAVTAIDPPRHAGHVLPTFLPDGTHFLFYAFGTPDTQGAYIGSLDGGGVGRLGSADAAPVFLSPDKMLFAHQDALMAKRLDMKSLEVAGDPITVAPRIAGDFVNGKAALSVSRGGTIAYRPAGPIRELVWLTRSGELAGHALGGAAADLNPISGSRLSPDGQTVAVVRRVNSNTDVWLFDLVRGIGRRFTEHQADDTGPVWSPDGHSIAFGSTRRSGVFDLYRKPADSSGVETLLVESATDKTANDWSPDGRFLLYSAIDSTTARDIWVKPLFGDRKPFAFVESKANENGGRFSPDGRWVAYQSNESGRNEIYVRPFPGPGAGVQISTSGGTSPQWRDDGRELFFIAGGKLTAIPIAVSGSLLEPGAPGALFDLSGKGPPTATSSGQRFLASQIMKEASLTTVLINWSGRSK